MSEASDPSRSRASQVGRAGAAGLEELLALARQIDQEHRLRHHRPVSAETLRKQMRIGSMRARALVRQVRDSHDANVQITQALGRDPQRRGDQPRPRYADGDGQRQAADPVGELAMVAS